MSYLRIENLTKNYGSVPAVNDFSLEIPRGQTLAIAGPDGAGKTTVIRCLCGLVRPDTGTIVIGGREISSGLGDLRGKLGYMPQTFSLYTDLSVEENLVFYAGIYGVTGTDYKKRRDSLYGFSNLGPFRNRRAGALSGGMKQKLALSCALIHEPDLLVLDEPTTGVDPLSRRQFWKILEEFRSQGVTILVTTPYMDEVARVDQACLLYGGHKLLEGTPRQLTESFSGNVFRLPVSSDPEHMKQVGALRQLAVQRFGSEMHLYTPPGYAQAELESDLSRIGINPDQLESIPASLEDLFIQMMQHHERQDYA